MIWAGEKKTVTASLWVFSNAKLFIPPRLKHSCREIPLKESEQLKIASPTPWKWPDSVGPSLPEKAIKAEGLSHKEVGMQSTLSEDKKDWDQTATYK